MEKMIIERDGKQYELTHEELSAANTEFVTDFMKRTLVDDFGLTEDEAEEWAEIAYDYYCEGDKGTEYDCIELAYDDYLEQENKDE